MCRTPNTYTLETGISGEQVNLGVITGSLLGYILNNFFQLIYHVCIGSLFCSCGWLQNSKGGEKEMF